MKKIVSLDIGGTNTRVALINERYEIEKELIKPTVVGNRELFLENVASTVEEAIDSFDGVQAFAMGVPGRVRYDGYIYALPNVHINDVPLSSFLEERFHFPAYVINDAEVAALAESNLGPYKNLKSLYFVTISTGVGGALTVGGRLRNSSYEAGHTMTSYHGEIHEFEHLCSGTGIRRLADYSCLDVKDSREFFELVKNGHPTANRVYHDWVRLVSEWFSLIQSNFEPEVFTITGGVTKSASIFLEDLRRATPNSRIELCGFNQAAGLVGGAVLGFQRTEDK